MYNDIEECSKELAVVSYKLGLIPSKKFRNDLMLNPLIELQDLMSRVDMYATLEDNVK